MHCQDEYIATALDKSVMSYMWLFVWIYVWLWGFISSFHLPDSSTLWGWWETVHWGGNDEANLSSLTVSTSTNDRNCELKLRSLLSPKTKTQRMKTGFPKTEDPRPNKRWLTETRVFAGGFFIYIYIILTALFSWNCCSLFSDVRWVIKFKLDKKEIKWKPTQTHRLPLLTSSSPHWCFRSHFNLPSIVTQEQSHENGSIAIMLVQSVGSNNVTNMSGLKWCALPV